MASRVDGHDHSLPEGHYETDAERVKARIAHCPLCRKHDHTDSTPFGFTEMRNTLKVEGGDREWLHLEPVPVWWFTCPAQINTDPPRSCGDPLGAAAACDRWTPAGSAWRREHRELFGVAS